MSYESNRDSPSQKERNRRKKVNYAPMDQPKTDSPGQKELKLKPKQDSHSFIIQPIQKKRKAIGISGNDNELDQDAKEEFTALLGKEPASLRDYFL